MKHPLIVYIVACLWCWGTLAPLRGVPLWVLLSGEGASAQEVPQTIDDLAVWLRADAISGLADGDAVEVWDDESVNNYAFRASGTARPTYETGEVNGLPVVRFDGTNDRLWEEAVSEQFRMPNDETCTGAAFDPTNDTLWITDFDTGNIVNITRDGALIATIDTPCGASTAQGLAYDTSDDTLWIVDVTAKTIYNISKTGTEITNFTVAYVPNGVAYDSSGDSLWIIEQVSGTIRKYSASTLTFTSSITTTVHNPDMIVVDSGGNLLITDDGAAFGDSYVRRVNKSTGVTLNTYTLGNRMRSIEGIAFDTTDNTWWLANDDLYHESFAKGNRVYHWKDDGSSFGELRNVGGATIFCVRKCSIDPTAARAIFQVSTGGNAELTRGSLLVGSTSSKPGLAGRRLDADSGQTVVSATSVDTAAFEIHTARIDYTNSNAYLLIDGTEEASSTSFQTSGSTSNTQTLRISIASVNDTTFFTGDIAEIILYSRILTTEETEQVHDYLGNKYGITVP